MNVFRTLFLSAVAGSILFAQGCRHPNDPDEPGEPAANFGNALQMDGTADYVVVPHSPALALSSGSFTVEAWVRPGDNVYYKWIVAKAASNNALDYLLGFDRSGRFRFITRSLANDITGRVPEPNRWYHVVGVQDVAKGKVLLYVNGELEAEASLRGTADNNSADLLLGVRIHTDFPGTLAEYLDGNIDEVRIWNKALKQKDLDKCEKPLEGNEDGLVAYWNFDEASGADVLDVSNNGHDGVFGSTASPERVPSTIPR